MKKIGVVVAIEVDAVLEKYGTPQEVVQTPGYTVRVYQNDAFILYVLDSGAGEIAAAAGTQVLISVFQVDMILNFGVVGALTPEMSTAELCLVERVIHYDFNSTGWLNLARGQYPGYDSAYIEADPVLLERALELEPELKKVTCASADKFVSSPEAKIMLHKTYGADICEMEAAGILMTCRRCDVPCLLVKAISDSLLGGGLEFTVELDRVSNICFALVDRLLRCLID